MSGEAATKSDEKQRVSAPHVPAPFTPIGRKRLGRSPLDPQGEVSIAPAPGADNDALIHAFVEEVAASAAIDNLADYLRRQDEKPAPAPARPAPMEVGNG